MFQLWIASAATSVSPTTRITGRLELIGQITCSNDDFNDFHHDPCEEEAPCGAFYIFAFPDSFYYFNV